MLFQWTRLASNQFRLLERRSPLPNGEPSFVLKTFTFASSSLPPYLAITYQHASCDVKTESVVLNGRSFSIQKNALEALMQVQRYDAEGCDYLWLDSLCINQKDENERIVQEGVEGWIFDGAKCVAACLGGDAPVTRNFRELSKQTSTTTPPETPSKEELSSLKTSLSELSHLAGGHKLWSGSEINTKSDIVLYAGSDRFERRDLERVLNLVREAGDGTSSNGKPVSANPSL
jgi:hypothetical protein